MKKFLIIMSLLIQVSGINTLSAFIPTPINEQRMNNSAHSVIISTQCGHKYYLKDILRYVKNGKKPGLLYIECPQSKKLLRILDPIERNSNDEIMLIEEKRKPTKDELRDIEELRAYREKALVEHPQRRGKKIYTEQPMNTRDIREEYNLPAGLTPDERADRIAHLSGAIRSDNTVNFHKLYQLFKQTHGTDFERQAHRIYLQYHGVNWLTTYWKVHDLAYELQAHTLNGYRRFYAELLAQGFNEEDARYYAIEHYSLKTGSFPPDI